MPAAKVVSCSYVIIFQKRDLCTHAGNWRGDVLRSSKTSM